MLYAEVLLLKVYNKHVSSIINKGIHGKQQACLNSFVKIKKN